MSATGHWPQLDFSRPLRLSALYLLARGGGAGAGPCTWVTSDSQSQANGSMGPSPATVLTYSGAPVTSIRGHVHWHPD